MNFKHDICRITISCFLIYKIIMKNIFFNKLKSIFTFKTTKHILNGCAGDVLIEETTDYPIQSSKTGFDNHETITLDNIVNYLSSLPIWKKYNQKHSSKSTIGMDDLAIKPKQVKTSLKHTKKCNNDSTKLNKQFIKVNQGKTVDSYQSKSSKTSNKDDNQNQFKQDCSVPFIDDVLDLVKQDQEQEQKENTPNPISSNLISAVDTKSLISENDGNQSTDKTAITSVVETNQYEHVFQEFAQRIAKMAEMAKDTIVPLTFNHPFFEISYEKNPHFHFKDIQEISDTGLYELQETKELVSFPLFFYPVFTTEINKDNAVNETDTTKRIKFLLENDLDKDDYLESCLGGQIGLIYVDKEIIRQKYKVKRITKKIHDELVDEVKKLIKQLNQQ